MGSAQPTPQTVLEDVARAKVNLTLSVLGRRPDGYHALDSIVAFADIGDVVRLLPGADVRVQVTGPFGAQIAGENLALRALAALAEAAPQLQLGEVVIDKRLPVAAGLGGGSADAAAVLRLVHRANPHFAQRVDWDAIALNLGSDVPVCFASEACRMEGRGETLTALPFAIDVPVVLVNALKPVPADKTARVFKLLNAGPVGTRTAPPMGHFAQAENDLELVASSVLPGVVDVLAALRSLDGVRWVRMSGAGPTCFAVFDNQAAATSAAIVLKRAEPSWWVMPAALS